jgi:hypothetical protein
LVSLTDLQSVEEEDLLPSRRVAEKADVGANCVQIAVYLDLRGGAMPRAGGKRTA